MTQLNKADHNPTDPNQQHQSNKKLTKNLINSFNKSFDKAQLQTNKDEQTTLDSASKKPIISNTKNESKASFEFDQTDNMFHHFFPEFGISQLQHIEKMIITISQGIEKAIKTSTTETFQLILDKYNYQFQIQISKKNNQLSIKLTCDETLCRLLNTYMPELKKHLRKKSIEFNELTIESDESLSDNKKRENQSL